MAGWKAKASMTPRDVLLALTVPVIWGLSFIAIRWGVDEVSPLLLTAVRYLFAALPAVFFVRRPAVDWRILVGYGLAIGVGQFGLLFLAIKLGMPAGLSSLVIQLQVFFTILFAFATFGERPNGWQLAACLIAFGGIGVIALERLEGAALLPLLLTIAAAVSWGLGNMAGKKAGRIDMVGLIVWSALVPPLPLLAASLLFEGAGAIPAAIEHITWRGVGSIAFMSYIATIFGFSVWASLLSRYSASQVSPFALLIPVIGIAASGVLLGERITAFEIAGGVLVFAGLLVNVFGPRLLRPAVRAG
jgi:O-acetylserine/cysteine efflux transporter